MAPILVFHTAGYRYNFKRNKLEKTGIIYINSEPRNASIYINNKYEAKTPARFTYLLPDVYRIEVKKDGYYTWQKEIEVKSNLTTFAKNIVLFKKNLPINIVNGEINILAISPNKEKIIYSTLSQDAEKIKLLNLTNNSEFSIKSFSRIGYNQLEFAGWSPDQNKVMLKQIIGDFNKYLIINIETLKLKELFDITRLNFDKIEWDATDDNYLYGLRKSVLYQIDLINNTVSALLAAEIRDFTIQNDEIYYISELARESFLNKIIMANGQIANSQKIKLPAPSEYTLQTLNIDYLALLDEKNDDLFIISNKSFDDEELIEDIILQDKAKKIVWAKDLKKIIYYNDFEIWTFDLNNRQKNLVNRYGGLIEQTLWHPAEKYIIYQVENTIGAIESNGQEIKNDIKIAELEKIDSIVIDNQGKNLYFKGKIGNQQGIYKLEIQ
ncbi:MAG: PEGA domain-containing protein [Patescibacteria group bacterium]|nr:PEGA domain-containing protein [Patescibacteria group bacterium]